tara:strand:- start:1188 stop:1352 length:165 start_codon:yes stop_codon:yes gene_type:complete
MKKLQIQISDDAHSELLRIQYERKIAKHPRTTIVQIATDVLSDCLLKKKENPDQ